MKIALREDSTHVGSVHFGRSEKRDECAVRSKQRQHLIDVVEEGAVGGNGGGGGADPHVNVVDSDGDVLASITTGDGGLAGVVELQFYGDEVVEKASLVNGGICASRMRESELLEGEVTTVNLGMNGGQKIGGKHEGRGGSWWRGNYGRRGTKRNFGLQYRREGGF